MCFLCWWFNTNDTTYDFCLISLIESHNHAHAITNLVLYSSDSCFHILISTITGGFRYKRAESSDKYAEKKGFPKLKYLTWPRTGAFTDITDGHVYLTHIVDLTILYLDQRACTTILDIALGRNSQPIYFHYKIFEVRPDVAYDETWLNQRWLEKEQLMKSFYDNPDEFIRTKAGTLRPSKLSFVVLIFNQICILVGCFVMFLVVKYLVSIFVH